MIFRIIAILILLVFYTFYFAKIVIQKKQSIKTNQMGIGNKPKKVLRIERIMSLATVLAFVGFDLLYLSICLMFFNILLVLVSVWAAVMLHLQILQEEKHMHHMFGEEYDTYKKHTSRYFGKG